MHASSLTDTLRSAWRRHGYWAVPVALGLLLPALIFGLLPLLGVETLARLLRFPRFFLLMGGVVGLVGYISYFRAIQQRPHWLAFFIVMGWGLLEYGNNLLLGMGVNIRYSPLIMVIFVLPALVIIWRHRLTLWRHTPHFRFYLFFFVWLLTYYFFYNSHATDPQMMAGEGGGLLSDGSVASVQLTAYLYCLLSMGVASVAMLIQSRPRAYFDALNKGLLIVSSLTALYAILGYPVMLTSIMLDGFQRATGLFNHPNPFSHHMGLLMIYLFGVALYYQGENHGRVSGWLMVTAILLNLIAFLLGLSKTAIGVFALSMALLTVLNLSSPIVRRHLPRALAALVILLPLGAFLYATITGTSFTEILEARLEAKESLDWRVETWNYLISNISGWWIFIGHGFTDANAWVYQLTYNNKTNAQPLMMVHNGYIALLYDLGVMGYLMFAAVLALAWRAFRLMSARICEPENRPLLATALAMALYFMVVCGFDEMTYMFDAPILFWTLASTLVTLAWRLSSLSDEHPDTASSGAI
ncbi:MAG: O-antigen ligase family protein [Vampirovibrionales bacterium]|nr:O-antigen ligase family protein [Vampirovibrionales bacterium]